MREAADVNRRRSCFGQTRAGETGRRVGERDAGHIRHVDLRFADLPLRMDPSHRWPRAGQI